MTHRDGFPRLSARSAWRGDAGHREPCVTPSESPGKPPFRSRGRTAGGRRKALTMSRIARGFPPTRPLARRIARPISMGHYRRSLVLAIETVAASSRPRHRNCKKRLKSVAVQCFSGHFQIYFRCFTRKHQVN